MLKKSFIFLNILLILIPDLFSFNKWDQRVVGIWHSSKLKSRFNFNSSGNFTLTVTTKKTQIKITGKWRASQKYLYLEYFKLKTGKTEKVYYKTMIYRITKITNNELILKHRYNTDILTFTKQ